jgi:hypothetical protein
MVANDKKRLTVNKQRLQLFHMERFNLKKFNEVEGKDRYYVEVCNRYAALVDMELEQKESNPDFWICSQEF